MAAMGFQVTGTDQVVHDLTRFRQNITRAKPALEEMAGHVAAAQREQFNTEGRHYGSGWDPLSPRYKTWKMKRRPGKKILEFDGTLRSKAAPRQARNFGFYKVTNSRMEVGVSYDSIPYAKFHQEGASWTTKKGTPVTLPARPIMGQPTKADQQAMTKILHKHILKGTAYAGGAR